MTHTILISGSSSGIGRAISEKLLTENYSIIGLARRHEKFNPKNSNYFSYSIDFAKIAVLEEKIKMIQTKHSDINTLICCAGYGEFSELEQFSVEKMQNLMNVNFLSQAILIKFFLPLFKKNKSGKVFIIGSECALEGQKKGTLYCASKFALRGFAQSLRKECAASEIQVTLINPGLVRTPFFDDLSFQPGRDETHAIESLQISDMISFLLKQKANFLYEEINLQPMKKVIEKKS